MAHAPETPTLPGSLGQHLHDIGTGRRAWPAESSAKRHHYIAQFLLRGFLGCDLHGERLWQLDKLTGVVMPQSIEVAASVRRLYRVQGPTGENDHLESFFALVESHAARSLRRLKTSPAALDEGDRANLSLLLALQDQRTPAGQRRVAAQLAAASRLWFATELTDACRARRHYLNTHPGASEQDAEAFRVRTLRELQDGTLRLRLRRRWPCKGCYVRGSTSRASCTTCTGSCCTLAKVILSSATVP